MDSNRKIAKSASIVAAGTFLSRILGMIRDILSASIFGTSFVWDVFLAAFTIPNFFRRLFAEGALSAAFIPVFTEYRHNKSKKQMWELFNVVSSVLMLFLVLFVVGLIIVITVLRVMGFAEGKFDLLADLARLVLPYLIFISLASLAMGALNTFRHFITPSLSPVMLNISWICSLLFICPVVSDAPEEKIFGVAIGVLIGGALQLAIQIPPLVKRGFRFKFSLNFSHPALKRIFLLMTPVVFGLAVTQINFTIDTFLGLLLGEGAISSLYYGNRLMQLPLGVFGIALGTAIFPSLSSSAVERDFVKLKDTLSFGLRTVFFITIPAAVGLIALSEPIVSLLFQRNEFDAESTLRASRTLTYYCLGLCFYSGNKILSQCYYALKDTKTPVKIGVFAMLLNVFFNLVLMWPLREGGLALATAITGAVTFVLLFSKLIPKIGTLDLKRVINSFLRICLASSLLAVVVNFVLKYTQSMSIEGPFIIKKCLIVFLPILAGIAAFIAGAVLLNVDEMKSFLTVLKNRGKPENAGNKSNHK